MTLGQLLESRSGANPTSPVLYGDTRTLTWSELNETASALAEWFHAQGLRPGDRVAIHWSNSVEVVQLFFGIFKAGLAAVPVNTRLKSPEVRYILQHSEARMIFSEPCLAPVAQQAGAQCLATELPRLVTSSKQLPRFDADQPAAIMYTSGTTAQPKGVIHTHRTLIENSRILAAQILRSTDRTLVLTQMMHASGLYCLLLPAIYSGGSVVLARTTEPAEVLDTIERLQCTYSLAMPAMLHCLLEEQQGRPRDLRSLKTLIAGGDSVPIALQDRVLKLLGIPVLEGYGLTEAVPVMMNPPGAIREGSLGIPLPDIQVRIVNPEGTELGAGEVGEIVVESPGNCIGYWRDEEATTQAVRGGRFHTGDLGVRDIDGYTWFKGRLKQIIIRGGSNISPQEVEEALYSHSAVREAGVVGIPDAVQGERVIAFAVLATGHAVTEDDLRAFTSQRIAEYKVPDRILFVPTLPKGPTGKVNRRSLKERLLSQADLLQQAVVTSV